MINNPLRNSFCKSKSGTFISDSPQDNDKIIPVHNDEKFQSIFSELIETEQKYTRYLSLVLEIYASPLRSEAEVSSTSSIMSSWITIDEVERLFHDLSLLHCFHEYVLLPSFSKSVNVESLFEKFLQVSNVLHLFYLKYTLDYDDRIHQLYQNLRQRKSFKNWESERLADPRNFQMGFLAYTIMPIQRLPRYLLLFEGLLKASSPADPWYNILQKARNRTLQIITDINDMKRNTDDRLQIIKLQERLLVGVKDRDPLLFFISEAKRIVQEGDLFLESMDQCQQIQELIDSTLKVDLRVCDQWITVKCKFTPFSEMYLVDWSEMHILGYFDLKRVVIARNLESNSLIVVIYEGQILIFSWQSDLWEKLQIGTGSDIERCLEDFQGDYCQSKYIVSGFPPKSGKMYRVIVLDRFLLLCKNTGTSDESGLTLKLKHFKRFEKIRRVTMEEGNIVIWIGLLRYRFSGHPDDVLRTWVKSFTSLNTSSLEYKEPVKEVSLPTRTREIKEKPSVIQIITLIVIPFVLTTSIWQLLVLMSCLGIFVISSQVIKY